MAMQAVVMVSITVILAVLVAAAGSMVGAKLSPRAPLLTHANVNAEAIYEDEHLPDPPQVGLLASGFRASGVRAAGFRAESCLPSGAATGGGAPGHWEVVPNVVAERDMAAGFERGSPRGVPELVLP